MQEQKELLWLAHQWGKAYGRRPSEMLLDRHPAALLLDLAALHAGAESDHERLAAMGDFGPVFAALQALR